jgi:hypothetical protein
MKRPSLPAATRLLLLCVLLVASVPQIVRARDNKPAPANGSVFATSGADGGRLVVMRSPTLGRNVSFAIAVDGKPAGSLSVGRNVDRYITPGRHVVTAWATSTDSSWSATLEVRAGETYSYSASYNVNQPVLTPLRR